MNNLGIENPISANNLWDAVIALVNIVRFVAIPFLVLAIMWSGFLFVKAQGSAEKIGEAKKVFFWTMVATLIILSSIPIAEMIRDTFS
jgi:flagellar biosynthesis protein FlhB